MTIVPAAMALLGKHAWWLPRWLDRILPRLDIEGQSLEHQVPRQVPAPPPAEPAETASRAGQAPPGR
jgi:RND superfamily putative drug exporter